MKQLTLFQDDQFWNECVKIRHKKIVEINRKEYLTITKGSDYFND